MKKIINNNKFLSVGIFSRFFGAIMIIVLFLVMYFGLPMQSMKNDNQNVILSDNNQHTLVFYKDNCGDCKKLYPSLYWQNVLYSFTDTNKQMIFINVNSLENKHYIKEYKLKYVPSVFKNNKLYDERNTNDLINKIKN